MPLNLGSAILKSPALPVRNETGSTIAAGSLVYLSGWSETHGRFLITKADADAAGKRATFVMRDDLATATNGTAHKTLRLTAQNTNGAAVGDPIYLSATAGGWTLTQPTATNAISQIVGRVAVVNASTGEVEIDVNQAVADKLGSNELQGGAVAGQFFLSAEVTGNGSSQDTAHGLGRTPTVVLAFFTELDGNAADIASGAHDGTNCKFTVTSGQKYKVLAV